MVGSGSNGDRGHGCGSLIGGKRYERAGCECDSGGIREMATTENLIVLLGTIFPSKKTH